MRDDEKMFNLGMAMLFGLIVLIVFLQVCYRKQNADLRYVRNTMESVRQETEKAETKFLSLKSADYLRGSVVGVNPKSEIVSYSKTVHVNSIPMVEE